MLRSLTFFTLFACGAFLLGSLGYLALQSIRPKADVFGALYRMFCYHDSHPFQYIAVVAITYGMIATACMRRGARFEGWRRALTIVGIMIATILTASIPGGVLWKIHDMQAGFFTAGMQFWSDLFWGASTGMQVGWLVIAASVPYNIIGLILGYVVTHFGFRASDRWSEISAHASPP